MTFAVQFAVFCPPGHFDIPKTIEADSAAAAIKKAEDRAYGLGARSVTIFAPGTLDLDSAKPLESRICDYSGNDA